MSFSHGSSRFSKISARVNRQFTHAGHAKASAVPFVPDTYLTLISRLFLSTILIMPERGSQPSTRYRGTCVLRISG